MKNGYIYRTIVWDTTQDQWVKIVIDQTESVVHKDFSDGIFTMIVAKCIGIADE